jgi:hypothetical protein
MFRRDMLPHSSGYSCTMMMEVAGVSEIVVPMYKIALPHILERRSLHRRLEKVT